tara:strand:+ start:69 stop:320 length:252 start_codon:yes stop_codon:yes gene_type:complete
MAKVSRKVKATAVQWVGTTGSLKSVLDLCECEKHTITDKKQLLKIQYEEAEMEVKLNNWVVSEEGEQVKVLNNEDFNSTYTLD